MLIAIVIIGVIATLFLAAWGVARTALDRLAFGLMVLAITFLLYVLLPLGGIK